MDRRSFISDLAYGTAGLALACASFSRREMLFAQDANISKMTAVGYGELFPTPAKNTGETFLKLPRGFEYNVIGKQGSLLSDGRPTPRCMTEWRHLGLAVSCESSEITK